VTAVKGCCAMLSWPVHTDETCLLSQQCGVKRASAERHLRRGHCQGHVGMPHNNRNTHSHTQTHSVSESVQSRWCWQRTQGQPY